MQLKSPTDTPIYVALTNGHGIRVGPEGCEVAVMFRSKAFELGCIPVGMTQEEMVQKKPAPTDKEHFTILCEALKKLRDEDTPLTGAGLPNRNTVSAAVGWNVSAVELTDAWNALPPE